MDAVTREDDVMKARLWIEDNMDFLCVTGVEDKLQEDVSFTISKLRDAGIQIWMLTGDKIETAHCIAISTSLKDRNQTTFMMT